MALVADTAIDMGALIVQAIHPRVGYLTDDQINSIEDFGRNEFD